MTYISADFDQQHAAEYTLLARIGHEENALAVLDNAGQLKVITAYDPRHTKQEVADLLNLNFGRVKLAVPDGSYSFVPGEAFRESALDIYRRYLPGDGLADTVISSLPALGITLLHHVNQLGLEPFVGRFSHLGIYPVVQPLLAAVVGHARQTAGPFVSINKQASCVNIAVLDSGKFIYANDFEVFGPDDLNYYLLAVLTNGELIGKQPVCCLSGDIAEDGEFHRRVTKYSEHVVFADSGQLTGVSLPQALQLEQHQYLTLLGLYLCE
ncbi:DUF3822 family protein [Parapedobacter sp. ISTM3]|uniref:DUF3822 family protein n=1 Tax=Parapedobacter luteus TaxID=623280 RepID=A0A1T5AX40_9SPHI|nr:MULTISPECIES: DUF3822 family protein [Parapedobacter]MBK1440327.1 DUF3822 family protein [Parapedobacter sp. ISTM3]SKB39558.1 Protein of unknown function [Parapedobacter luteus]